MTKSITTVNSCLTTNKIIIIIIIIIISVRLVVAETWGEGEDRQDKPYILP